MPPKTHFKTATSLVLLLLAVAAYLPPALLAQSGNSPQELKQSINDLITQQKYLNALPLLEKIVVAEPNNSGMRFYLAFALIAKANNIKDEAEKKGLRARARGEFVKAKELGDNHPILNALLKNMPVDGSEEAALSKNTEADALMDQAEALFSQGKLDDALVIYQKALLIDPKLYEAAVFSGDVYTYRKDWDQAEIWYQKAILIDPAKERAYRYSATPFMKQGKYDLARDRYVEAYITEPYSKFSQAGLSQWANITKTQIGHPKFDIPNVKFDEKGSASVDVDASTLMGGKEDGSSAWIVYGGIRVLWHKERFASTFPDEKTYRHSLNEEADALRSVVHAATADKKVKRLNPSLAKLKQIDDSGLLEAYILLATPDDGIAADFSKYIAQNRAKLRRYVVEYVLTNGGK